MTRIEDSPERKITKKEKTMI